MFSNKMFIAFVSVASAMKRDRGHRRVKSGRSPIAERFARRNRRLADEHERSTNIQKYKDELKNELKKSSTKVRKQRFSVKKECE